MQGIAHSAQDMISGMTPVLQTGEFVFVTTNDAALTTQLINSAIATFREKEGLSILVPIANAQEYGQNTDLPMQCITLNVFSSLEGVGLTAAVATALSCHNIPCNMIAAYHHDHVFVPSALSARAMEVLEALQSQTASGE